MIRTLLTTTAVALLLSAPAMAQDAAQPAVAAPAANGQMTIDPALNDVLAKGYQVADTDNLATKIIGAPVYTSGNNDAERIGDINDIVLGNNGQVGAVVIGVGGFLGMGEKNVAVDFKSLQWTVAADNTERWVLPVNKDSLTAAADFQWRDDQPADTTNMAANDPNAPANNNAMTNGANGGTVATDTAANTNANANNAVTQGMQTAQDTNANANAATPGAIDVTGMTAMDQGTLTADDLHDVDVIGSDNTEIAEVDDIVLTPDGKVDALLIDFGGFLGIGQKTVAVGMENLQFMQDQNGKRFVKLNATRDQLDAAPAYDKDNYAQNRQAQRLVVGAN